ncbi:MAG: hypothetical protein HQK65_04520 [Desulfamplus sp.]|nr:hypothetical protein [Desulfamplus sp.]
MTNDDLDQIYSKIFDDISYKEDQLYKSEKRGVSMTDDKTQAIMAITIITLFYMGMAIFVDTTAALSQLVSTAIGGILGIAVGRKS